MLPIRSVTDHGVKRYQHFAHDRSERDLAQAMIVIDQVPVEGLHVRIVVDGAAGAVEEHFAHAGAAMTDGRMPVVLAAIARVRGKAAKRRNFLARQMSEFRQVRD